MNAILPQALANTTPSRPRVLYVDHTALLSGGEIALLNLLGALDRTRFEPIVLLGADGPLVDAFGTIGVETHVVPLDASIAQTRKDSIGVASLGRVRDVGRAVKYVRTLARFIREHRIDLVHTNSLKADILGGLAARLARRPVIWHLRDRVTDDYLPPIVARAFRLGGRLLPTFIIANSGATLATMGSRRDRATSAVVYSGFDVAASSRIVHDGLDPDRFHSPRDTPAGYPIVGLLGRISPWKGQHIFIRAAAEVAKTFSTARFRIIGKTMFGEDAYEREVRELVSRLGLQDRVEFSGFRSDVSVALSELTLLVHASTSGEPFGQVIVEAMAAGLPVVATDGGGVPEIVQHETTGLLVPMGDVEAMAAAIERLLTDPVAARAMGQRGRERARDWFSIERTARAVESIYEQLLGAVRR